MNYAIFLSGGTGTRAGADIPKQYQKAGGRMMAAWALDALLLCEDVNAVVIVIGREWRDAFLEDLRAAGVPMNKITGLADPGENRQLSIVNGMREALRSGCSVTRGEDTVLIHDAARPFLTVMGFNLAEKLGGWSDLAVSTPVYTLSLVVSFISVRAYEKR